MGLGTCTHWHAKGAELHMRHEERMDSECPQARKTHKSVCKECLGALRVPADHANNRCVHLPTPSTQCIEPTIHDKR